MMLIKSVGWSRVLVLALGLWFAVVPARAGMTRFVVDDDAFLKQVCAEALKLKEAGKLVPMTNLQCQFNRQFAAVPLAPVADAKYSPADLYERLLRSTFAVGLFYYCEDCANWQFNAGVGFVVASNGVLCTSGHVVGNGEEESPGEPVYLIAADHSGHVFPVREVLAADVEADTCLLKIYADGLTPLALRPGARTGERIYCLGHPDGNHFMFTDGMVARVMRSRDTLVMFEPDGEPTPRTRPLLYLNVTAEFSPGASGGPIVDEAGNVLAQVQSIKSLDDGESTNHNGGAFSYGVMRYCVAAEEMIRLTQPPAGYAAPAPLTQAPGFQPSPALTEAELLGMTRSLFERGTNALIGMDAPLIGGTIFKRFDACVQSFQARFPVTTNRWELNALQVRAWLIRHDFRCGELVGDPEALIKAMLAGPGVSPAQKTEAVRLKRLLQAMRKSDASR